MNLSCLSCGGLFGEWDSVKCDGCERITHRDTCGVYQLINQETEEGSVTTELVAYFFCDACMDFDPDEDVQ